MASQKQRVATRSLLRRIRHAIDAKSVERGLGYYLSGRVLAAAKISETPSIWRGMVSGQARHPYRVDLNLVISKGNDGYVLLDNDCTCPLKVDCKHVIAVLAYLAEHDLPTLAGETTPEADGGPLPSDKKVLSAEQWAEEMLTALETPPTNATTYRPAEDAKFIFLLQPPADQLEARHISRAVLSIHSRDRRIKRPAPPKTMRLESRSAWDRFYRDSDNAEVCHRFNMVFPPRDSWDPGSTLHHGPLFSLPEHGMQTLFSTLIASGRTYYHDFDKPLYPADELTTQLKWLFGADGRYRLTLNTPSNIVLIGFSSLFFIDTVSGAAGGVRTLVPSRILKMLLQAPSLSFDEALDFYNKAPQALKTIIPQPSQIRIQHKRVVPQPKLELFPNDSAPTIDGALSFCYESCEIMASSSDEELVQLTDDNVQTIFPRARDVEAQHIATLNEMNLNYNPERGCISLDVPNAQRLIDFFETSVKRLVGAGWHISNPENPIATSIVKTDSPFDVSVFDDATSNHWFQWQLTMDVEGERIDLAVMIAQLIGSPLLDLSCKEQWPETIYLPLRGRQFVGIPKSRVENVLSLLLALSEDGRSGLPQALALSSLLDTEDAVLRGRSKLFDTVTKLRNFRGLKTSRAPKRLHATLRPYQLLGLTWLEFLHDHNWGGILADDMGLGKTLQIITFVLRLKERKKLLNPALVVVPSTLLTNWLYETKKFAPSLRVVVHHGLERDIQAGQHADIVLTSYGILVRDQETLATIPYSVAIFDESHVLKNPRSRTHHAARQLKVGHTICLSGTPLQNNLEELWAQFALTMPALLGTHRDFGRRFNKPISVGRDASAQLRLNQRTKPFILRRTKAEVADDLPPKSENIERVSFGRAQADIYESVRSMMSERVREEIARRGLKKSHITILSALLKMRQVCCDPRLLKHAPLVKRADSAKLSRLLELAQELVAEKRTLLVFSQFTEMLGLISQALDKKSLAHLIFTGKTTRRDEVIQRFQSNEVPIMLISLKAGGVGLNLTAADTVIHYDPWWNPAVEDQATDRAYRIGQDKPVHVYKLIVAGSLEEKILDLQAEKKNLVGQVFDEGTIVNKLSAEDLTAIFSPLKEAT